MVNQESLIDGGEPLEIERKYLIRYPDVAMLEELGCRKAEIRQDYLPTLDNKIRRIRASESGGEKKFYYTEKMRISDLVRIEREKEISEEEYNELVPEIAPETHPVIKTRYYYDEGDLCFEIDLYPEWTDKALVEVELKTETTVVNIPKWMKVIREVTADNHYKNEYFAFHGFEG